jgi:hypothetical protein
MDDEDRGSSASQDSTGHQQPVSQGDRHACRSCRRHRPRSSRQPNIRSLQDRAERIARSITRKNRRAQALGQLAVAATDPHRAARLLADTERILGWIHNKDERAWVLIEIAEAVAATDPDRAKRITQSITLRQIRVWLLLEIAKVRNVPTQN